MTDAVCPACYGEPAEDGVCPTHGLFCLRPPALARLGDYPALGSIIERRYALRDVIGDGGMGTVYRALQISMNRDVALKVLQSQVARKPTLVKRFHSEARIIAGLRSDHAVKVHDFGTVREGPLARSLYMVMEVVEGTDLARKLAGRRLPPRDALLVLTQVADCLDEAHGKGIVHRDLKPANLLVTTYKGAPRIKVIDFGIARVEDVDMTGAQVLGTPSYMAPELWRRTDRPLDGRVDVYAMGVVLYQMLTGQKPFASNGLAGMALAHTRDPVPALAVVAPHLARFDPVLQRALAKDPRDRHPTLSSLARDFEVCAGSLFDGAPSASGTTLLDLEPAPLTGTHSERTAPSDPQAMVEASASGDLSPPAHATPSLPSLPPHRAGSRGSTPLPRIEVPAARATVTPSHLDPTAPPSEPALRATQRLSREAMGAAGQRGTTRVEGARAGAAMRVRRASPQLAPVGVVPAGGSCPPMHHPGAAGAADDNGPTTRYQVGPSRRAALLLLGIVGGLVSITAAWWLISRPSADERASTALVLPEQTPLDDAPSMRPEPSDAPDAAPADAASDAGAPDAAAPDSTIRRRSDKPGAHRSRAGRGRKGRAPVAHNEDERRPTPVKAAAVKPKPVSSASVKGADDEARPIRERVPPVDLPDHPKASAKIGLGSLEPGALGVAPAPPESPDPEPAPEPVVEAPTTGSTTDDAPPAAPDQIPAVGQGHMRAFDKAIRLCDCTAAEQELGALTSRYGHGPLRPKVRFEERGRALKKCRRLETASTIERKRAGCPGASR